MMMPQVKAALDAMLEGVSRRDLAQRAQRISELYRSGQGSRVAIRDYLDALAYTIARMPATLAAIDAAKRSALTPSRMGTIDAGARTLLDLGAGPGTAALAFISVSGIERVILVETNPAFREFSSILLGKLGVAHEIVDASIGRMPANFAPADMVVMSYVQVEMTSEAAAKAVAEAARLATSVVLLVEPGTPAGFARIRVARDILMRAGLSPLAPCPGAMTCPMIGQDWCHFSERLARSRDHKILKAADAPFEDERYCYFAAIKGPAHPASARVLSEPRKDRGGITARVCTERGVEERQFKRADKQAYVMARGLEWGDAIEAAE